MRPSKLTGTIDELETPMPIGVGGLFFRADGRVLAACRRGKPDDLGIPGGKVEPGETELQAIVRELREETAIRAKRLHHLFAAPDAAGYWFVTFLVYDWEDEWTEEERARGLVEREKGVIVQWAERSRLLRPSCSFRAYNEDLFSHLGMLPPR